MEIDRVHRWQPSKLRVRNSLPPFSFFFFFCCRTEHAYAAPRTSLALQLRELITGAGATSHCIPCFFGHPSAFLPQFLLRPKFHLGFSVGTDRSFQEILWDSMSFYEIQCVAGSRRFLMYNHTGLFVSCFQKVLTFYVYLLTGLLARRVNRPGRYNGCSGE